MRLRPTLRRTALSVARSAMSTAACTARCRRSITTLGRPLSTTRILHIWSTPPRGPFTSVTRTLMRSIDVANFPSFMPSFRRMYIESSSERARRRSRGREPAFATAVDQVPRTAPQRPHREIEPEGRNRSQQECQRGVALADGGAHRVDCRGRVAPACLEFVDRRDFFRRYCSNATALLWCMSGELLTA
jgi:hypothetical protein